MGLLSDLKRNLYRKGTRCSLCNRPLVQVKWRDESESDKEKSFMVRDCDVGAAADLSARNVIFLASVSLWVWLHTESASVEQMNKVFMRMSGSRAWLK
jgi:hypothetical protein